MTALLVPASVATARFFPEATDVARFLRVHSQLDRAKAIVVEGDLAVDREGLVQIDDLFLKLTAQMGKDERLAAIIVTGSIDAPAAVLMERDIDWSPRLKVLGDVRAKSLILGGSASEIAGGLVVEDTLFGFYNHGSLRVGGKTRAKIIFAADYELELQGEVDCQYAISWDGRMNIPIDFARDRLHLVLVPEVIDETNFPKDEEIVGRLGRGESIIRPRRQIGRVPKPKVSRLGRERLAALRARAEAGETITEIDLRKCELGFVPDDIRQFPHVRALRLSSNEVKALPDWIGEFADLEILEATDCGLSGIPASIARHPRLREVFADSNDIVDLACGEGTYQALVHLRIGGGCDAAHVRLVAGLDLADFPMLRYAEQRFNGIPVVDYPADADLWNAPRLEYLDFDAVWKTSVPAGLAKAAGLKGLTCSLTGQSLPSALDLLPRFADLEVLSLGYGSGLAPADLQTLADALPGIYIRIKSCDDLKIGTDDPRYDLKRNVGKADRFEQAAAAAAQLFADMNLARPRFEADFQEDALAGWLHTLMRVAAQENDPDERRTKVLRAAQWADRILAALPSTPDLCWLVQFRDLGLLRFRCLLAQAARHVQQPSPELAQANALLDRAEAEADRHVDRYPRWRGQLAADVAALRATIPQ